MLALDEKNEITEFEEHSGLKVCNFCHRIYRQSLVTQTPGMREREYDICPVCGQKNDSSMQVDYYNSKLTIEELKRLKKKSLVEKVVEHCHQQYIYSSCTHCEHQDGCPGKCPGNCKKCLEEVHYPLRYPHGMKDYVCDRMLNFYVCDYTVKYASELLYLMRKSKALEQIEDYHVLSIGCGACPDLMAFERYCHEKSYDKGVSYIGIDVNERWRLIHKQIESYRTKTLYKTQFRYMDAVTEEFNISRANVIVLQYVISHFYNTGQIGQIEKFFKNLVRNIIVCRQQGKPLVVLINDVNSNNGGRDCFTKLAKILDDSGLKENSQAYYFDYYIQNGYQRYGMRHESNCVLFDIPRELDIYEPWRFCSSAQLLIEVF